MEGNAKPRKSIKTLCHNWVYGEGNNNKIPLSSFDKHIKDQLLKCGGMAAVIILSMGVLFLMTDLWALLLVGAAGLFVPGMRALNIYRIVQQDRCYYVEGVISAITSSSLIHDTTYIDIKTEKAGILRINYIGKNARNKKFSNDKATARVRFNVGDAVRLYYDNNTRLTNKEGVIVLQEYITLVNAQ